jgi:hypothetical protein
MVMTIRKDIDRYFHLNTIEKLGILRLVSDEVLQIINQKNYTIENAIVFLDTNIRIQESEEKYEVAEILLQIKQILEERENGM